jgi:anaerobic selenocysteine-containing dehydrogenase
VINHAALGDALTGAAPPVRMTIVYNNNPVAVCPDSEKVLAGFRREDLFCVVMDSFLTDTADYADLVLPATTQLEHVDVHKSYGHLYVLANNPAIAPVGESLANSEVFRRLAARMGFEEDCFRDSDEDICRTALKSASPRMRGIGWEAVREAGWQRLAVAERFAPFAEGGFPTPSGKCEFYSAGLEKQGIDPLPFFNPPAESVGSNPVVAAEYPLAFLSPPARNFLNSSFAHLKRFRELEGEPRLEMHAADAQARGIRDGDRVRVFNARGSLLLRARVNGKPRRGVVVAPSVWWKKYSPDRGNANNLTAQRTADLGGGATFYDCLVQSRRREQGRQLRQLPRRSTASDALAGRRGAADRGSDLAGLPPGAGAVPVQAPTGAGCCTMRARGRRQRGADRRRHGAAQPSRRPLPRVSRPSPGFPTGGCSTTGCGRRSAGQRRDRMVARCWSTSTISGR